MSDPASLQNLNDIVSPAAVPWWPLAPGWYVLGAILLMVAFYWLFRGAQRWQRNRYRREALDILAQLRQAGPEAASRIPPLLKRAALSAFPREEVAALNGADWYRFLDASAATDRFMARDGVLLGRTAYRANQDLSTEEFKSLCEAAEYWLRQHRAAG